MTKRFALALAATLTAIAAEPAVSQGAGQAGTQAIGPASPATTVEPLVVTPAPILAPKALERAVDSFVQARQTVSRVGRIARWRAPICVETLGLPEAMNAAISARIAKVGAAIGAPPSAAAGCQANVEVLFTPEPQTLVDLVARREWVLLGYHYAAQTHRITRVTHPIQAWYVTGARSYSNGGAALLGQISQPAVGTGQIALDDPLNQSPGGEAGSRLGASLGSEFANVLIVVDQTKVAGQSTEAIADYVAVLAYAPVADLDSCNPLPSILDLLGKCDPPRTPDTLTASDLAYLKALYEVNTRLDVTIAKGAIAEDMRTKVARR